MPTTNQFYFWLLVYLNDYQNIYEAKQNLFKFISEIYNQQRLHSSLGYLPPNEVEENYWQLTSQENINNYDQAAFATVLE